MKIVAMDLGKSKTVVCIYDQQSGRHKYQTIKTGPQQIHDLIMEQEPGRVVFEICSAAGWVFDIARCLGIDTQVANTNGQAWRWKNIRRKNDREDALKLAQLSAIEQFSISRFREAFWRSIETARRKHFTVPRRFEKQNEARGTSQGYAETAENAEKR